VKDLVAAYIGARRQGKTTLAKQALGALKPARLMIFDPMDEYGAYAERVATLRELRDRGRAERDFSLRIVPPYEAVRLELGERDDALVERFDTFCCIGLDVGNLLMLADELQLVVRPRWSPPGWREATLRGGHARYGVNVIGVAQQPSQLDDSFWGQCNIVTTCRVNRTADIKTMADVLDVERDELRRLERFHWIARNMDTRDRSSGVTTKQK
jgi:hypothetical protein